MARKKLSCWWWAFIGTLIVILVGSLLHFVYEWSNESSSVKWLAATNESTWEHMKLAVWPYTITTLLIYFIGTKDYEECCERTIQTDKLDVWLSRSIGLVIMLLYIPTIFYLYTRRGKVGNSILPVDILIFITSAVLGNFISCMAIFKARLWTNIIGILLTMSIPIIFIIFSYYPPTKKHIFFPYEE